MDWLPSFARIAPWHWWIFGALLLLLELAAPGILFVWLAAAAFVVGLFVFVVPLPVSAQLLLFALLAVLSVYAGRRYVGRLNVGADPEGELLGKRGLSYLGRRLTVTEAIHNGVGRVRVGDSVWRARGPDTPAGETVRVVGVEGATLLVERLEQANAVG